MSFLDTLSVFLSAIQDVNPSSRLANESFSVSNEAHYGYNSYYYELLTGASLAVTPADMSVGEVLYIVSDRPLTISLNTADHTFTATHLVLDGGNITSIVFNNNQSNTAHFKILMLGT